MSDRQTRRKLNEQLRWERLLRGWTQQQVADHIGTDGYTVNRWERGRALPSPFFRQKLCTLFGKNAAELGLLRNDPGNVHSPGHCEPVRKDEAEIRPGQEQAMTSLPHLWHIPFSRNPFFVGRESILQQLDERFRRKNTAFLPHAYALSGLGGIGKTQIAVEYAYRYIQDYSAFFWICAQTSESILSSFVSLAERLHLPEQMEQDQSTVMVAVMRWLNTHQNWLMIVDHVEDVNLVKNAFAPLRQGALLFTSRLHTFGALARIIEVEPLPLEEGVHLLLHHSGYGNWSTSPSLLSADDQATARTLAAAVDGHPLALAQAGAYLEQTQCSLSDFLALLHTSPAQVLSERDPSTDYPLSVMSMLALSFETLQQRSPGAAQLLTLCCFLAPEAIPEAFITEQRAYPSLQAKASSPLHFNTLIKELLHSSLIRRHAQSKTITVHPLVQTVLKAGMSEDVRRIWSELVLYMLNETFLLDHHPVNMEQWSWCKQMFPHAFLALSQSAQWSQASVEWNSLLIKVATYLLGRARHAEAEPLSKDLPSGDSGARLDSFSTNSGCSVYSGPLE